jgi:hypothetical protein
MGNINSGDAAEIKDNLMPIFGKAFSAISEAIESTPSEMKDSFRKACSYIECMNNSHSEEEAKKYLESHPYMWELMFDYACMKRSVALLRVVHQHKDITVLLERVFEDCDLSDVSDSITLLRNMNNVDSHTTLPINVACYELSDIAEFLLDEMGIEIDRVYSLKPNGNAIIGSTLLSLAVSNGKIEMTKYLISRDANVSNLVDVGREKLVSLGALATGSKSIPLIDYLHSLGVSFEGSGYFCVLSREVTVHVFELGLLSDNEVLDFGKISKIKEMRKDDILYDNYGFLYKFDYPPMLDKYLSILKDRGEDISPCRTYFETHGITGEVREVFEKYC